MAKYGPGLTIKDVCKLECREARQILRSYHVNHDDRAEIISMIKEAYFQFQQSNDFNKTFIQFVCKQFNISVDDLARLFFKAMMEGSL